MKKILTVIVSAILASTILSAQDRIINRYGFELLRVKGGYRLLDENNIVSKGIFDLSKVPADMYEPYYRSRTFLKDEDFHQCETIEMVFAKYPSYELKLAIDLPKKEMGRRFLLSFGFTVADGIAETSVATVSSPAILPGTELPVLEFPIRFSPKEQIFLTLGTTFRRL